MNLLRRLGHPRKTPWNVWGMERYQHGAGVVTYLARSLRGGPLKNARLVADDGERGTCTGRARPEEADGGRSSAQRRTVAAAAVRQRRLRHVPVPQTRVVRSYGLYHATQAEALAVCRAHLGQPPVEVPLPLAWQTVYAQGGDQPPERCPACGQRLVCPGVIPRGGAPPPVLAEERAACAVDCRGEPARGGVCLPTARARWPLTGGNAPRCPGGWPDASWAWGRAPACRCHAAGRRDRTA